MDWLKGIDKTWTIFLDRDGVLNHEIDGDYVRTVSQLVIYPYIPVAIARLNGFFHSVIVVTNQRGIGRGLMSEENLLLIHETIQRKCMNAMGHIDEFYYSIEVEDQAPSRKPQIGMALLARNENPNIDFTKSIMVGNSPSDIQFGKNAGMKTIFLTTTKTADHSHNADMVCNDLAHFVEIIDQLKRPQYLQG
jgi:histidinol-phosphate phosphatase family protein